MLILGKWRQGHEMADEATENLKGLAEWVEAAGDVVNAASDAIRQAEPMVHPDYQAEGYWVPADHWRPLVSAVEELD